MKNLLAVLIAVCIFGVASAQSVSILEQTPTLAPPKPKLENVQTKAEQVVPAPLPLPAKTVLTDSPSLAPEVKTAKAEAKAEDKPESPKSEQTKPKVVYVPQLVFVKITPWQAARLEYLAAQRARQEQLAARRSGR
jgi:hypothetical protein